MHDEIYGMKDILLELFGGNPVYSFRRAVRGHYLLMVAIKGDDHFGMESITRRNSRVFFIFSVMSFKEQRIALSSPYLIFLPLNLKYILSVIAIHESKLDSIVHAV